ncbi:hypothetical protein HFP43_01640 [Streptomyces sp. SJ1-7]|nr:hypothetical protein [Streptomyces sp. SJ1-7]
MRREFVGPGDMPGDTEPAEPQGGVAEPSAERTAGPGVAVQQAVGVLVGEGGGPERTGRIAVPPAEDVHELLTEGDGVGEELDGGHGA